MRRSLRFLHRGRVIELQDVGPTETVLDYLRLRAGLTGTKEGCGEGDCGACTVALGRLSGGRLVYKAVNSCILFLGQLDGAELVTVDDLASDERLHPVQQALVEHHGSQCGFCTPGFVMSLFTLYHTEGLAPSRKTVTDWLAGNLCRCTGYRPIVDAAMDSCFGVIDDAFSARARKTEEALRQLDDRRGMALGDAERFFAAPASVDALARALRGASRRDGRWRGDRRRSLGHQATARPAQDHLDRGRVGFRSRGRNTGRRSHGGACDLRRHPRGDGPHRPGPWRTVAQDRLPAGAQLRHRVRKHRQRLPHW